MKNLFIIFLFVSCFAQKLTADINRLQFVNGKPDLQSDNGYSLIYAGELYLQQKLNSKNIKINNIKDCKYDLKGDKKTGWLEGEYKNDDGEATFVRLQFVKSDKGWEVFRQLRADQLIAAHPIEPFDLTTFETDLKVMNFLTAKALEEDLQKEFPGKGFSGRVGLKFGFNPKTSIGYSEANFCLHGETKWVSRTYLFGKADGQWQVERALKDSERVNTKTGKVEMFVSEGGKTLSEAIVKGDAEVVKVLLEKGADVNAKDAQGITPLIYAAAGGNEQIVKMLIEKSVDVNIKAEDGRGALYISVARGDFAIVNLLIEAKADVKVKDGHGSTVLHTAAVWDRDKIAEILIRASADVNAVDGKGNSVLDLARWWSSEKTAKLLEDNGAKTVKAIEGQTGLIGRVCGMELIGCQAEIDSGIFIKLFGTKGHMDFPVISISLNNTKGTIPAGRTFRVGHEDVQGTNTVNNIYVRYTNEVDDRERSEWLNRNNYELKINFGEEKEGVLEGQVMLECCKNDVRLKGNFKAKITGLRMVDGHPGLGRDSLETLVYATKLYLQGKLKKDEINVTNAGGDNSAWYDNASPEKPIQSGGIDVKFNVSDGNEQFLRVQLRKDQGKWKVVRELKGNELFKAHPIEEINKEDSSEYFLYLVSQRLEKDLQQENPNSNFRSDLFASRRLSSQHGAAEVKLDYKIIGSDKRLNRRYLFRHTGNDWAVERLLTENEKLNTATGAIEKK